jgi:hypothetical protein
MFPVGDIFFVLSSKDIHHLDPFTIDDHPKSTLWKASRPFQHLAMTAEMKMSDRWKVRECVGEYKMRRKHDTEQHLTTEREKVKKKTREARENVVVSLEGL